MAKHRSKSPEEEEEEQQHRREAENETPSKKEHHKSKRKVEDDPDSEEDSKHRRSGKKRGRRSRSKSRRKYSDEDDDSYSSSSESDSEDSDTESESGSSEHSDSKESEEERRRRKRRERKKREEREKEKRRRREKEKKRRRKEREEEEARRRKKKKKKSKDKKDKEGKKGAVTNSWGKYGIIRETDMWNKRPEFTAWLAEVKQVNLESLPNWEEKQMFKQFMEDHNTGTFPSKKYYNLDAYYKSKMEKQLKKGLKQVMDTERIIFNDEEQRRQELNLERQKAKEKEVEALMRSMQGGMAQAMKEQALLREEMALQYKLGNLEAAAAIQRRLDPDVAM